MGSLVVLYVALFSIFLNVGAKDVPVAKNEITLKTEYMGEASYAISSNESSELTSCFLQSPNGTVYQMFPYAGANLTDPNINFSSTPTHHCGIEIRKIDKSYLGKWLLTTNISHFFKETQIVLASIMIEFEEEVALKTDRLGTVYYGISSDSSSILKTCNLQRQNGICYQLYPALEGNITDPNIKYKSDETKACGFEISNITTGHQGVWILSTEFDELDESYSVTQPLSISIEEEVGMIPTDFVSVYEGESLFIVFAEIPDNTTGCEITVPGASTKSPISQLAQRFYLEIGNNCSMTFRNVTDDINGQWHFKIRGDVIFTGKLNISVIPIPRVDTTPLDLQLGSEASLTFGPKDATYCRASDPTGLVHATQNGRCSFRLPVASRTHQGQWEVQLGLPGVTETRTYNYIVNIGTNTSAQINPDTVVSSVLLSNNGNTLQIVCSLMVPSINSCRMVRSDGNVFTPTPYLGSGRYSYYGKETYEDSKGNTIVDCGIEVREVESVDLLSWQCIITHGEDNTEVGTYIDVLDKDDPRLAEIAGNMTTGDVWNQTTVLEVAKNSFELKCSQPNKIEYCWFRSPNNTQLVAIPGASNPAYEYVGRGLNFGECGIKIKYASLPDTGNWICNMGTANENDIKRTLPVKIYNSGIVQFYKIEGSNRIMIGCKTYDDSTLEYCRFVRPDGQGISPLYTNSTSYLGRETSLARGICQLTIVDVEYQDLGTWVCAGKSSRSTEEYQQTITITRYQYYVSAFSRWNSLTWIFYFISIIGLIIIMVMLVKRAKLASRLKNRAHSFRQSFNRKNKPQSQTEGETEA